MAEGAAAAFLKASPPCYLAHFPPLSFAKDRQQRLLPQVEASRSKRGHPALGLPKRAVDVLFAGLLLILLSPLFLLASLIVLTAVGRPILFRQKRPGLHGRPFNLVKFRSMTDRRDADGALLEDAKRLGRAGRFLRATSLDELPELINVLKGEMSLVGPRPLLMDYLPLYSPEQQRRHDVRPGLTGLAQVSGRNALTWQQRFALDLHYVDRWSLWLDAKILALTVSRVARVSGIRHRDHATSPRFEGNGKAS